MLIGLLFQIKVFIFIMALLYLAMCIMHVASVFYFKSGKIVSSKIEFTLFGASLSYILTMLICGF